MRRYWGAGLMILGLHGAFAQAPEAKPAFDVASVKVISSGGGEGRGREAITTSPSGVTIKSAHLKSVVAWAYNLQPIQIVGPGWMDSDTYDIVAKAPGEVTKDRLRLMMQTLLVNRFKLDFHRDTKEMPAYVLSVAKSGLKLKPSETPGTMQVKPNGKGGAAFSNVTLEQLIQMVSPILQGVVVDDSGLTGSYDFSLDLSSFMNGDVHPSSMEDMIAILTQAANDQLGIKIEQKKVPATRLLVDHIERVPSEN